MAKMHAGEVHTDVSVVGRLLAAQFPQWAGLPIVPVPSAGTDNALYRLGADMVVRLPRIDWAVDQVAKEQRWLPRLAPHLPLEVPVPLAQGVPGAGYPWPWSVYPWIEGEIATRERLDDPRQAAIDLARFVAALQRIDAADRPSPEAYDSDRGVPLGSRDARTRAAIGRCVGLLDREAVTAAWAAALRAPAWHGAPVWMHGDLKVDNLLARRGRLCAVIDFGSADVGDPACDVMAAWMYLDADTRGLFRDTLGVDEAMWARGRGWALSVALIALPYYRESNPALANIARRTIEQVLADPG